MAKTSPAQFIREVRQETNKVTWPTKKETGVTTMMVFIMVTIAAIFFLLADQLIAFSVKFVLGLGG
jgi:preprotein translocase subunit SecE